MTTPTIYIHPHTCPLVTANLEFRQRHFQTALDGRVETGAVLVERRAAGGGGSLASGQGMTDTHQSIYTNKKQKKSILKQLV